MKSSEPWFFACFNGLLQVPSLFGTLEPFSPLLGTLCLWLILWTAQEPWFFACFYGLLRSLFHYLFLWTDWNTHIWLFLRSGSLSAFMKSSEASFFACFLALTCIGCKAEILSCFYAWNPGTLRLCLILWTARNPASLPTVIKSQEHWFFAFYGLLTATYNLYSSELTCIGCIAQIPNWFYAWNSVPSLLGTLESFSALLGTLRLCQILWTVQNPAYLSAFIKS